MYTGTQAQGRDLVQQSNPEGKQKITRHCKKEQKDASE